jgi:hypothetical protein
MERWKVLPEGTRRRLVILACATVALFAHIDAVDHEFAFDDVSIVLDNKLIHSTANLGEVVTTPYWPGEWGDEAGLWRPAVMALYTVQWALWDGNPTGFHTVLLVLHALTTALVVILALEFVGLGVAGLAGLVFALHPIHVEAVANVVGTAEVLSTLFVVWACVLHVRGGPSYGYGRVAAVAALYALAFLTKEGAITFLGLVFLLDGFRRDLTLKDLPNYLSRRGVLYAALITVAAVVLHGRRLVLGTVASAIHPLGAQILHEVPRIWTVLTTWPHYVRLLLFPLDLSADYSPQVIPLQFDLTLSGAVGLALVLVILVLALLLWSRGESVTEDPDTERFFGFGVLWVVITMSPVSNVLFLSGILLAERTFYLASVGFALTAAWGLSRLLENRGTAGQVAVIVWVGFLGWKTIDRVPSWSTHREVFLTLYDEHPESGRVQWTRAGWTLDAGLRSEGYEAYRIAIGFLNRDYPLMVGMADQFVRLGDRRTGAAILDLATADWPDYPWPAERAAMEFYNLEQYEDAIRTGQEALARGSEKAIVLHVLASSYSAVGDHAQAVASRQQAIAQGQDRWEQWGWLANDLAEAGRLEEAISAADSALARGAGADARAQLEDLKRQWADSLSLSDFARDRQNP